jgi:flavin reductase (DIM6/NTAB) family NADH-FMN oxidoreductase RutF
MLVGVSIGHRRDGPKDTLRNIRDQGDFCVNVVTVPHLEAMNATSGDYPSDVNEFEVAGLPMADASVVDAPYVGSCPAVLECRLFKEVALGDAPNSLVVGEVLAVRLSGALRRIPDSFHVDTESLQPVGRLWGGAYFLPGQVRVIPRPRVPR